MIALANFHKQWPDDRHRDEHKLIKLMRQLTPQSTSREIDDEEPATYTGNRMREHDVEPS